MSVRNKSIVFLLLTFAFSWSVAIGGWMMGLHDNPVAGVIVLTCMMAGPALAALICAIAFEKDRRLDALGLRFRVNWWWLFAWAIPLAIAGLSVAFTLVLGGRGFVDIGQVVIASAPAQAAELRAIPYLGLIVAAQAVIVGAALNAPVLTLTEELGWRGYLHDLWRPSGFWRTALATGFIWGLWHAPAILFYGLNYPANREIGVPIFIVWCMLLSPIMTLVRDRGRSTWAAGILHGTVNAVGGLSIGMLSDPSFPWAGIVGIGGFLALALGVAAISLLRRQA